MTTQMHRNEVTYVGMPNPPARVAAFQSSPQQGVIPALYVVEVSRACTPAYPVTHEFGDTREQAITKLTSLIEQAKAALAELYEARD